MIMLHIRIVWWVLETKADKRGQRLLARQPLAFEYAKHQPPNNDNDVSHGAQLPDDGPYER